MGRHRNPGQPGSASSNPDAIANPDTEANPNPNATTYPAANASTQRIAASNTVADPGHAADGHGPDGCPAGATSGSQRRWRWRPACYRCGASGIGSGTRDRAHHAGRQDRGRFGGPG